VITCRESFTLGVKEIEKLKDHTWNQKLSVYQANTANMDHNEETGIPAPPEAVSLPALRQKGILEIEIYLNRVESKWRLDKLLSQRLIGISRSEAVKWIKQGVILVDGVHVKSGLSIQEGQSIWIDLRGINQ
jgi:23S rRNA-/tRNA-specific pseudouridylate synthase